MANVTAYAKGGSSGIVETANKVSVVTHELDIADFIAGGGATTNLFRVVTIPANTYFRLLQAEVVTAFSLGAGARLDLGDSADDDEFVSNASTLTAGTDLTIIKGDGSSGDVYTAADHISLKVTGGTIASGKIRFVFLLGDANRNAPMTTQS